MKFRVRAKFAGDTRIAASPLHVDWPPYRLTFEGNESGAVISVSVEMTVQDYKPLLPTYDSSQGAIVLGYPENPIHADLLALLQYLESVGAFWCGVHEVSWETATEIDESYVKTLLHRRRFHEGLTVPLAFYREGQNEFRRFRYIQVLSISTS
jgi:hypothetical protein